MSSSAAPAASAADLHVIYAQHDLTADLSGEGQGVNKPVVRKRNIIDALKQSATDDANANISFEALSEPAESLQAAERVHAPQLLRFFATGFERWAELCKAGQADLYFSSAGRVSPPDWSELVPSQCAPRDAHQRPGSSVHGECNYYAQDAMTPITEHTSKILHHDLAVTMAAVAAIASGSRRQVYACTTQPGHHSGPESYGGYCYVNQAALATRMLQDSMGKVALLDVDYHAGNGSMAIFHDDPQVYFASIHADPEVEYPYCCGFADQTGPESGPAANTTLNLPLGKGTSWAEYEPALRRALDAIREFGAKALVVSLGVDTLANDPEAAPLAGFALHGPDYHAMGALVRSIGLPIIWVQEGGYLLSEAGDTVRRVLVGPVGKEQQGGN